MAIKETRQRDKLAAVSAYYEEVWVPRMLMGHNEASAAQHFGLVGEFGLGGVSFEKMNTNQRVHARIRKGPVPLHRLPRPSYASEYQFQIRCLDLGCGVGGTMMFMHDKIHATSSPIDSRGICSSPREQEAAEHLSGIPGEHIFVQDYHDPLQGGPYGAIYAIESLCHSWDRARVIDNIWEALVPGGMFLCMDAELTSSSLVKKQGSRWSPQLRAFYSDVCIGMKCPDLYECNLANLLEDRGFEALEYHNYTPDVAPDVFESAGKAFYKLYGKDFRGSVAVREHLIGCIGLAGLLCHNVARYGMHVAVKPGRTSEDHRACEPAQDTGKQQDGYS